MANSYGSGNDNCSNHGNKTAIKINGNSIPYIDPASTYIGCTISSHKGVITNNNPNGTFTIVQGDLHTSDEPHNMDPPTDLQQQLFEAFMHQLCYDLGFGFPPTGSRAPPNSGYPPTYAFVSPQPNPFASASTQPLPAHADEPQQSRQLKRNNPFAKLRVIQPVNKKT